MKRSIIIDCDPGQDDAVALLWALSPAFPHDLLGITTVAGNVPAELTQRNARIMCDVAGRHDVGVFGGCVKPMVRRLLTAEEVHGKTGIDGVPITEPKTPLGSQHAVDFLISTLRAASHQSVTLVPVGPLTNIAMALVQAPDIVDGIEEIVLMGGAMREGGNTTPSAEFNILVDPHAADVVFKCGRPITAMGLDVTHQVLGTKPRIETIRALDNGPATATAEMLSFFSRYDSAKYGVDGAPLHDPCTIAYLLQPELFTGKACNVRVETQSSLTMGHTAVDFWQVSNREANTNWIYDVDADGFYTLLTEYLASYG